MLQKEGRIYYARWKGADLKGAYIYVSADLVKDSQFPLKIPARVNIRIDGDHLIIGKVRE